jgi:hypothetical protein
LNKSGLRRAEKLEKGQDEGRKGLRRKADEKRQVKKKKRG